MIRSSPGAPSDAKAGEIYKLHLNDLSPTQFAVGKAEIQVRARRLRKKFKQDPGKLHDYHRVRSIPVVIKVEKFYLVDHHHLARGLYEALHKALDKKICVYVRVLANAGTLGDTYFWKNMYQENWVYLFDESAFVVDDHGTPELNDDGKEVLDEALFFAISPAALGLPGFRGSST